MCDTKDKYEGVKTTECVLWNVVQNYGKQAIVLLGVNVTGITRDKLWKEG